MLFYRCEECGHISFHPIRWIKSIFRRKRKVLCNTFYHNELLLTLLRDRLILDKFMEKRELPENKDGTIKFRRFNHDDWN